MPEATTKTTYLASLAQAGLSQDQALIYECLIKNGALPAGKISQKTPLKRGLVYKLLEELEKMGLVLKHEEAGKVAVFEPAHPLKLKELAEKREEQAKTAQAALSGVLAQLTSQFNLISGQPGFQYYEGLDGMKKVLADSLQSKTEILSYADIEAVVKYINEINQDYVSKRERLGIKKRGIVLDAPFAREYLSKYHLTVTESRLIKYDAPPFESVMQIYDEKISYLTLATNKMIGIIITDPHIYTMHKYIFEYIWQSAAPIPNPTKQPLPSPEH